MGGPHLRPAWTYSINGKWSVHIYDLFLYLLRRGFSERQSVTGEYSQVVLTSFTSTVAGFSWKVWLPPPGQPHPQCRWDAVSYLVGGEPVKSFFLSRHRRSLNDINSGGRVSPGWEGPPELNATAGAVKHTHTSAPGPPPEPFMNHPGMPRTSPSGLHTYCTITQTHLKAFFWL